MGPHDIDCRARERSGAPCRPAPPSRFCSSVNAHSKWSVGAGCDPSASPGSLVRHGFIHTVELVVRQVNDAVAG